MLAEGFPREVVLYFGSQTGTAEKFCTTLEQELNSMLSRYPSVPRSARVADLEEFKPETFVE